MSIWKNVQDKAVLSRMEEEALYAAALDQYESGERRRGLWAKALVEAGGDPAKAESTYLRILVAALRDELYVAGRLHEQAAGLAYSRVIETTAALRPASVPDRFSIQKAAGYAIQDRADFSACEVLIRAAGGTVEAKGFIFGAHYLVTLAGASTRLNCFEDLLAWVKHNLPLQDWSSGQS